jgi:subtilisin-like proprotein convertase family protein
MFKKYLLLSALAIAQAHAGNGKTIIEVHDQTESAAAISTTLRMQPLAGQFDIQEGTANGDWSPGDGKRAPRWVSRHAFELAYNPLAGTLVLHGYSFGQESLTLERRVAGHSAANAPNLMRIEVANFDANASVRLEKLELVQGETVRTLRGFGRGAMTSDLATIWEPSLAEGFTLRGTLKVDGTIRPADARVWVDFGLGSGRRVAVDVEGYGWVKSSPAGIDAAPGDKESVGFFAPNQPVRLEAMQDPSTRLPFRGWVRSGEKVSEMAAIELPADGVPARWTAEFDAPTDKVRQSKEAPMAPNGNGDVFVFNNNAAITVPAGAPGTTTGPAGPYPATIQVAGPIGGAITDVNVTLNSVTHTFPDDLDVLVVSPYGTAVLIMSDACGPNDINGYMWTFDDQAAAPMTDATPDGCDPFVVQPTNYGDGDTFPPSAPAEGYESALSAFNNQNPNGIWRLFVFDDVNGDVGTINSGWSITITTEAYAALIPGTGSAGPANPYPLIQSINQTSSVFGAILDVDVHVVDVTHEHPDDLDMLVTGPSGTGAILMSDACGSADINNYIWIFDDEAPAPMSDSDIGGCNPFNVQPSNFGEAGDAWPAPAPAGPFNPDLGVFDGQTGIGQWRLFINDDASGDVGFLETDWFVELTLDGIFRNGFEPLD